MTAPDFATWTDIEPIALDDGGPSALATINYTPNYAEATAYLRALMAVNETSARALELTAYIISLNPAHYTVWLYRAAILFALDADLTPELTWLNEISLIHLKNYQIWHHRQMLVERLGGVPPGEAHFLSEMMARDAKNYHVWGYRQWLVRRFGLWDGAGLALADGEMAEMERLLGEDIRNNSAWNHRWFLVFGREDSAQVSDAVWEREMEFAKSKIAIAPMNESAWRYLQGLLRWKKVKMDVVREFVEEYAGVGDEGVVKSSFALDMLADIYAEQEGMKDAAVKALELLAEKYDPIRVNYWNYRKSLLVDAATSV